MTDLRKAAEDLMPILERWKMTYPPCSGADWEKVEALRQALAQPEWVGLTRRELDIATLGLEDLSDCYKAIEAKLKEKNA